MSNDPINTIDPSGGIGIHCPGTSGLAIFLDNALHAVTSFVSNNASLLSKISIIGSIAKTGVVITKAIENSNVINGQIVTPPVGGLYIGGDIDAAFADLISILPDGLFRPRSYRNPIPPSVGSIIRKDENGKIEFNMDGIPEEFENDPAVIILNAMANGSKRYQYNVSDFAGFKIQRVNPKTGQPVGLPVDLGFPYNRADLVNEPIFNGIGNFSKTPLGKKLASGNYAPYHVPFDENIDGELTISWNVKFYQQPKPNGPWVAVDRKSIVFHEILESYNRTTLEMIYDLAHPDSSAKEAGLNDSRRSHTPGTATTRPPN
jgi:hypothetical protein